MGGKVAKFKAAARSPQAYVKSIDKVLESKPVQAPRHPSTVKAYEELSEKHPEFKEAVSGKNVALHSRLESVRVESTGPPPDEVLRTLEKFRIPAHTPDGKLSIEQIRTLFMNRKVDENEWTSEKIADEFKIEPQVAANLVRFYSTFHIVKPVAKPEEGS